MAYVPALRFPRSAEERADPALAWRRSDEAFFASGACHILAFTFRDQHPDRDLAIRFIDPADGFVGTHLYVVDGGWALDFNGWTPEAELLAVTGAAWADAYSGWSYELRDIPAAVDLEAFCADGLRRAPRFYAHDPRPRARAYLARFPDRPPVR
ncbi:MAG TPA: hypothetical protein VNQ33_07520 [Acidimicrobiales bacterium]|nr:hypothetical protein [Acidimicrobiales bacterium]